MYDNLGKAIQVSNNFIFGHLYLLQNEILLGWRWVHHGEMLQEALHLPQHRQLVQQHLIQTGTQLQISCLHQTTIARNGLTNALSLILHIHKPGLTWRAPCILKSPC